MIDHLLARVWELHEESRELHKVARRQMRRVDQLLIMMGSYLEYTKGFNSALVQMFANYRFSNGMGSLQFPPSPVFGDPIEDSEGEEDATTRRR